MTMITRRSLLFTTGALGAISVAGSAAAFDWLNRAQSGGGYFQEDGVALRGADVVAYFTEGRPVIGSAEHSFDWGGTTWHFASAANRDAFAADPGAYAPQYGGFCAWGLAAKGKLYSTQPENWAIVDGKLYLNFNDGVQARWNKDRAGFISKADAQWPAVAAAGDS